MNIAEARGKCKIFLGRVPRDVLIISILILASSASFGLGYLAGLDAGGQGINSTSLPQGGVETQGVSLATTTTGQVVASKNGTKYYLPSCSGVDKISDANKVWFTSTSVAAAAGYTPAANCKGL